MRRVRRSVATGEMWVAWRARTCFRDALGGGEAVACEHDGADAQRLELLHRGGRLGLERVVQDHHARDSAVHRREEHAAAASQLDGNLAREAEGSLSRGHCVGSRLIDRRGSSSLLLAHSLPCGPQARRHVRVLVPVRCLLLGGLSLAQRRPDECGVPNAHPPPLHRRTHAVAPVSLEARHLRQALARCDEVRHAPLVARHQAACQWVVVLILDGRHPPMEHLPRVRRSGQRLEPQQLELARRQRAGLVEADGLDRGEGLQRGGMLDQQPVALGQQRERRTLHEGRRAEQRARAAGDEHHEELLHALVAPQHDCQAEDDGRVPCGEAADERLRLREGVLGVLHRDGDARLGEVRSS